MVETRRQDVRRDRTRTGKRRIIYRPITTRSVKARIHDLRHTTGMRTLRRTGNLKLVQKPPGHSDIKTTATFYTDAMVEDLRAAMEATAPREINPPKSIRKTGGPGMRAISIMALALDEKLQEHGIRAERAHG
jgi:hypothetical protein